MGEAQSRATAPPEKSKLRSPGYLARMPLGCLLGGCISGMSTWEETLGQTVGMLEKSYLLVDLSSSGGSGRREECQGFSSEIAAPRDPEPDKLWIMERSGTAAKECSTEILLIALKVGLRRLWWLQLLRIDAVFACLTQFSDVKKSKCPRKLLKLLSRIIYLCPSAQSLIYYKFYFLF